MRRAFFLLMAASLLPALVLADLHDPSNSADYLIVTTQQVINGYPWINQLAAWRNDHGRTAMVVPTDSIWAQFGTGVPSDSVLKAFLHYAWGNWQAPQLKDVFLIGYFNVVPAHMYPDSTGPGQSIVIASDYFYGLGVGDSVPVFNIGRLPWNPVQHGPLYDYFAKVVAYETAPTEDWQQRVLLVADTTGAFNWADVFAETMVPYVHSGYSIERDYGQYPFGNPWHASREDVLVDLQAGSYWTMYFGEGAGDRWSETWNIDSSDFGSLTNSPRFPIVIGMAWDALVNFLTPNPHVFLANGQGGAIGYYGFTGIEWAVTGTSFRRMLVQYATSDSAHVMGDILRLTDSTYARGHPVGSMTVRHTLRGRMLFGDPGLVLPPRPTAARNTPESLPESIRLLGNYPNPFNASTEIRFELNRAMPVSLKVYDVLGREAATLVDGMQDAGTHAVTWNAQSASSGVYFAGLQAGDVHQVRKMMLLK